MTLNRQEAVRTKPCSLLKWIRAAFFCAPLPIALSATPASLPPAPAPVPLVGDAFPAGITAEDRQSLERDLKLLEAKLTSLYSSSTNKLPQLDHFADAGLFHE